MKKVSAIGLVQEKLPFTASLLRMLFGSRPVQGLDCLLMPEVLVLDYVRMLLVPQRLPILVLNGAPQWHKVFIGWLQDVVGAPMKFREARDTEAIRNSATYGGTVVVNGPITPELVGLLGLINNNATITVGPPLEKESTTIIPVARYILTTQGPIPATKAGAPFFWYRMAPDAMPAPHLAECLRAERMDLLRLLKSAPIYTRAESPFWFNPESLEDSTERPDA